MTMKSLILCTAFLLVSCDNNQTKLPKLDTHNDETSQTIVTTEETPPNNENNFSGKQTLALLQGKWQHIDDQTNYLVFEGNHRKEIAGDMNEWDDEEFILSDKCLNESNKSTDMELAADQYITCSKSDLCWYIISVDEKNLTLSYMGRGNTLEYRRVK